MTEHRKRLNTIRAHLRTGAVGQREVWEEWLTEAAAEIERLRTRYDSATDQAVRYADEIERLKDEVATCRELRKYDRIEIERMRILLDRKT